MKLPKLFGDKKDNQEEIDQLIIENVTGQSATEKSVAEQNGYGLGGNATIETQPGEVFSGQVDLKILKVTLDKMQAQIEALNQLRQMSDRRFQTISEEIGDLRQRSIQIEKELNDLRLKSARAVDLVSTVQPERLMMEVEKGNTKVMKLKAKQDAIKTYVENIVEELKDLRSAVSTFRGTESLVQLNEEVKKELMNINKVQANVEKHSDKVEDIFIQTERRYGEFLALSEKFNALEKEFNEILKEAARLKTQSKSMVTKKDLNQLEKTVDVSLKNVTTLCNELENRKSLLNGLMENTSAALNRLEGMEGVLKNHLIEINDALSELTRMKQNNYLKRGEFEEELDEFYKSVIEKLEKRDNK